MRQVLRLWRLYAYLDLVWIARDAKAALTYYLSDLILSIAAVTTTFLLAERFDGIGAWSKPQVLFMLGYSMAAAGVLDMFFNYNVKHVSRRIGRGQLDHVLVQPRPLWLALLTEGFLPFSGTGLFLPGILVLGWSAANAGVQPSAGWLAALALNLVGSAGIVLAFSYLWSSLAFWAPRAAEEVSTSAIGLLERLKPFPLDGVGLALTGTLLTLVPAGFVGWYPARALLGLSAEPLALFVTPAAALALGACAAAAFSLGLREYGRTGSQRYTSFGHRR